MSLLKDLAMALYEAKMRREQMLQTEKAEESHMYKIDLNKINKKHLLEKEREIEAQFWKDKMEYERLKAKGFSDQDISEMIRVTKKGIKMLSKTPFKC